MTHDIRRYIQLLEAVEDDAPTFIHYSAKELPVGTILRPTGNRGRGEWAAVLEEFRPTQMIALHQGVFMFDESDSHQDAGGDDRRFMFTVQPLGPVQRHDAYWAVELDRQIDDVSHEELEELANNYWSGIDSGKTVGETMWEYITTSAKILDVTSVGW